MAQIGWRFILKANDLGFLKEPDEIEDAMGCEKTFRDGLYAGRFTQRGNGLKNAIYSHYSDGKGIIHTVESGWDRSQNREERWQRKNHCARIDDMDPGDDRIPAGIHFVDFQVYESRTGNTDNVYIEKDGRSFGWTQDDQGKWSHINQFRFAEGMDRANLGWADFDGDGQNHIICIEKFSGDGRVFYKSGPQ
ncbi:hypothetical protein DL764_005146 [Monosporascus ibericus]|uniref:Uncharacterized protein n=1 Tax=Monosporascus ibericus TaxID=155417 RepID=A0A4Q4TA34_9PEZI|nr:hypothetical protein DL764_005146 [Monosporascus ibericus]